MREGLRLVLVLPLLRRRYHSGTLVLRVDLVLVLAVLARKVGSVLVLQCDSVLLSSDSLVLLP